MWIGEARAGKPVGEARQKLLDERVGILAQIKALQAKPLPQGDRQQMQRFRTQDLTTLATKIVKIDEKLGRK